MADGGTGALTRREPRRGGRGLRERPRSALRQRHGDRPRNRRGDGPVARAADGGPSVVVRRRFPLVREHRRDPDRLRPDLAGRSPRGAVAGRRVHRRCRDHARLRDHRRCRRRVDDAPGTRTAPGARALRSRERKLAAAHRLQRPHGRRPRVPRRPHDPVERRGRHTDRGPADDPARRRRTAPAHRLRARRAHLELGRLLLRLGAERGAPVVGRLRVSAPEPQGQHRAGTRVRAGRDRRRRRHRLPGHHGRGRPLHRRGHRRSGPPRHLGPVLWRLHGGMGRGPDGSLSARRSRCPWSRTTSPST